MFCIRIGTVGYRGGSCGLRVLSRHVADPEWTMSPDAERHQSHPAIRRVLDTDDIDFAIQEVARALAPHRLTVLSTDEPVHVVLRHGQLGPVGIGSLSYAAPVEVAVDPMEEIYLAEIPLRGRLQLRSAARELIATPQRGAVINPTDPLWKQWDRATDVLTVSIDRATLLATAESWAGKKLRGTLHFDTKLNATAGPDHTWLGHVNAMVRDLETGSGWTADPALADSQIRRLMDGLLLTHPSSHLHVLRRADEPPAGARALADLLEQVHSHPDRPWPTTDMARAAGVGVVAVEKMFARYLDTTPQDYLQQLGLDRATADLIAAVDGETIGQLIRRARLRAGWSETALAAALNEAATTTTMTSETVSKWEHGKIIPGPHWQTFLVAVLGIPPEEVVSAVIRAKILALIRQLRDSADV